MIEGGQCHSQSWLRSKAFMEDQGCNQVYCTGLSHSPCLSEVARSPCQSNVSDFLKQRVQIIEVLDNNAIDGLR